MWSFIFDAMSKSKTRLPNLGNRSTATQLFDNNLMGCIFHNTGHTNLYMSGPSVASGVSYMIHCVHLEIKRCIDAGMKLPDKIYLQIDGASDNPAYAMYAALEHLIGQGLCSVIEVWRLPVGHTHEVSESAFSSFLLFSRLMYFPS